MCGSIASVSGKAIEDCYVIAKYDYVAQGSQELSLRKNDKLLLLDEATSALDAENEAMGICP